MIEIKIQSDMNLSPDEIGKCHEIFVALLASGGMFGVKGGQTLLHFDKDGNFQGVQLSYWPWRKRTDKLGQTG